MTHPDQQGRWQPHPIPEDAPQQARPAGAARATARAAAPTTAQATAQAAARTTARATAQAPAPALPTAPALPRSRRQAVPGTPPPPPDQPPAPAESDRTGPSGRAAQLHIGWHSLPRGARQTPVTTAPPTGAGLLLGRNRPISLLTPGPVRAALVGGVWAAQLLLFRAFALGARAIVVTTDPRSWSGFGERATGQYHRLTVLSSDQGGLPDGTPRTPALTVYDLGATGPAAPPAPGRWHTRLTLLRHLDRPGLAAVQEADLVLVQRLAGAETGLAASALRLPAADARLLETLADDVVALFEGAGGEHVPLTPTPIELHHLGPPRR